MQRSANLFRWTPDLKIGVDIIDREHRRLFELAEVLHRAMFEGRGKGVIGPLLTELADYCNLHFDHEESYMRSLGYPRLGEHQELHATLRRRVQQLLNRFRAGERTLTIESMQMLAAWVRQHASEQDVKIGEFAKIRNNGMTIAKTGVNV